MNNERLLQRLRAHPGLWDEREARVTRLILRVKARLRPQWAERAAQVEHQRGQRWLQTWA